MSLTAWLADESSLSVAAEMHEPKKIELPASAMNWSFLDKHIMKDASATDGIDVKSDMHTPKKVELPAEAVGWEASRKDAAAPASDSPVALGRLPASPPPATMSPSFLCIGALLEPSLPPALPPALPADLPGVTTTAHLPPSGLPKKAKLELPAGAVSRAASQAATAVGELEGPSPSAASPLQPRSLAPSLPPSLPISLSALLPPSPPPSLPPCGECAPPPSPPSFLAGDETSESTDKIDAALTTDGAGTSDMQFPPGLQPADGTPSQGAALHGTGRCRPCAWFWKPKGCQNGDSCGHCHLCPEGAIKARKKTKHTMMRLGLATPQSTISSPERPSFSMAVEGRTFSGDEQESTTGPRSEQELTGSSDAEFATPATKSPPGLGLQFAAGGSAAPEPTSHTAGAGSAIHGTGLCNPCAWFWKPVGCQNAHNCGYCHLCPDGELKNRRRSKMAMMRLGLATPKTDGGAEKQAKYALSLASLL